MFKKSILTLSFVALTAPFAGMAVAGPGADQLAALLRVPAGAYTVSQMIQLQDARREGDKAAEAFILSQGKGTVTRSDKSDGAAISAGAEQFARSLGVAPGVYSLNELIDLQDAVKENDRQAIAFILGGREGADTTGDIGVVTPGKAQLAAALGLDPAEHTTAELVSMYLDSIS